MRCEDCLPLIEEYFDKETDERTNEQIAAHLSTCADCAAALDSLSFEQEIYARYDRGLEVSPSLWSAVSAEIARAPQPERRAPRRNFLSRLRESFTITLAALTVRPALASSLALLLVAAAVGSLWLAYIRSKGAPRVMDNNTVADDTPKKDMSGAKPSPATTAVNIIEDNVPPVSPIVGETSNPGGGHIAPRRKSNEQVEQAGLTPEEVKSLIDDQPQLSSLTNNTVRFEAVSHVKPEEDLLGESQSPDTKTVMTNAQLLDPAQKELARHVEQTQMLLRSIKNARASDDNTVNVSYEKKLSRRLLGENATLQLDAESRGDKDSKQVLDQIEPFLLDIANMSDNPSREEVHSVKERMKKNEIIAALQVY